MNRLSTIKKKDVVNLSKRLEELNLEDPNETTMVESEVIKLALNMEANKEEIKWEHKARANWLKFKDHNTTYFHSFTSQRKR